MTRAPTIHELAAALAYVERCFTVETERVDDVVRILVSNRRLIEGLAYGDLRRDADDALAERMFEVAAREVASQHDEESLLAFAHAADCIRIALGEMPRYRVRS